MESCYKLYSWLNQTVFMLLLQIFWKMRQLSEYFDEKPEIPTQPARTIIVELPPPELTKESKHRRHIRSMSDVQSSTPCKLFKQHRKGSHHNLSYDSETRTSRFRLQNLHRYDSTDSSDCDRLKKVRSIEQNIIKPPDSMRIL